MKRNVIKSFDYILNKPLFLVDFLPKDSEIDTDDAGYADYVEVRVAVTLGLFNTVKLVSGSKDSFKSTIDLRKNLIDYKKSMSLDRADMISQRKMKKSCICDRELSLTKYGNYSNGVYIITKQKGLPLVQQILTADRRLRHPINMTGSSAVRVYRHDLLILNDILYRVTDIDMEGLRAKLNPIYFCEYGYPEGLAKELDYK